MIGNVDRDLIAFDKPTGKITRLVPPACRDGGPAACYHLLSDADVAPLC